jgi:hypothetical protein
MTTVIDVAPSQVRPSPFNHRKNFTGIDELGASLLEKGMINPDHRAPQRLRRRRTTSRTSSSPASAAGVRP